MTEAELREVMKELGWSYLQRRRRKRSYVYAARKLNGKREELYISPTSTIAYLTIEQIAAKLTGIVVEPL